MLYTLPFQGRNRITSPYGPRTVNGAKDVHNGFDIVGDDGTDIGAPCAGTVTVSTIVTDRNNINWQCGNYVNLKNADGVTVSMRHMASRAVAAGQNVSTGDKLGVMGNTGYSFGAHTHWEAHNASGTKIDPGELLGLADLAGVSYDREKMDEACIGYLECTVAQYRWRTGAGTSFALYKPSNTGTCMYCRKGVTYRVYAVVVLPNGEVWCQVTPPESCVVKGEAPQLWVSAACGTYTAKEQPAEPEPAKPDPDANEKPDKVDWSSTCNEFVVSATGADRNELRALCERLKLPVKNA